MALEKTKKFILAQKARAFKKKNLKLFCSQKKIFFVNNEELHERSYF
jgi:hypothetical protein